MKSSNDKSALTPVDELPKSRDSNELRKMGRPAKPRHEARTNRVVTLLTDRDYADLKELAENTGTTLSNTCRLIIGRFFENPSNLNKTGEK